MTPWHRTGIKTSIYIYELNAGLSPNIYIVTTGGTVPIRQ